MEYIKIRGAREHNLKNIDLDVPKNQLVVFTGLSGSGKSSLAFDTIYAEGQRRYVESLSSYARQFLGVMDKPDVDQIDGLSPAISIDQKSASHNPRSTVGTVTEIYDYLRLLFARVGHPHCPICGREIAHLSPQQIVEQILDLSRSELVGHKVVRFLLLSPVVKARKGEYTELFSSLRQKGYTRVRIDGKIIGLTEDILILKNNKHDIDVVIDRVIADKKTIELPETRSRLFESVENALKLSEGLCVVALIKDKSFDLPDKPTDLQDHLFSERFACPVDNISLPEIEPRSFSFNSPQGACPDCTGLGVQQKIDPDLVANPKLTLAEGAILPYARTFLYDSWFSRKIASLGFPMRIPLSEFSKKDKQELFFGLPGFEGIIPNLERRYKDTQSDFVRAEIEKYMRKEICPTCNGLRLKPEILQITIMEKSIMAASQYPIREAINFFKTLKLSDREITISKPILKEILERLNFLVSVGLDYLTLDRAANTLAGGEAQRIRLASQIGSGLSGVLYVLDEPSIGLHQRDNQRLIDTLIRLKGLGNSVVVVEHDADMMLQSDYIVDFGPGAGEHGGKVIAQGTPTEIMANDHSITGKYLSGEKKIKVITEQMALTDKFLKIIGASEHNLKNLNLEIPLGHMVCITGVSGSGKSTLVGDILYHALAQKLIPEHKEKPGAFKSIEGAENINRVIMVDQSPIGRTPRSNPATYTGLFTVIRDIFALTPEARVRGYKPGRFSFNVKGGRCEACEGEGQIKIEMQFLPDVYVNCEVCGGKRYNSETLEVHYKGKTVADVLDLTVEDALAFFQAIPAAYDKLQTLKEVGLEYLHLGQPAPTLSGGEAQRIKLATELSKRATGKTFYILDEPTTGLHFADLEKLLVVLKKLVEGGNTVLVIEHNLDVIKNADWIIDLGPEGGSGGGEIVAKGTPEQVAKVARSYTGQFLAKIL